MPARGVHPVGTDGVGRVGSGQLPEEWQLSHWVKTRDFWNLLGVRVTERFLRPVGPQNQVRVLVPNGGHVAQPPFAMGTHSQLQSHPLEFVPMHLGTRSCRRLYAVWSKLADLK